MQDRIHWQEPQESRPRGLHTKVDVRIDLAPALPGRRSDLEEALRILFPGGYTKQQVGWFIRQAAEGVSRAVIAEGRGMFPLDVALVWNPDRQQAASDNIIPVQFRRDSAA